MDSLYFGGPVDGGTYPAVIWGEYMANAIRNRCDAFEPPTTPFTSTPFLGKYANSGGSAIGGPEYVPPYEPPAPTETEPEPATEPTEPAAPEPVVPADPATPDSGGFDPTQYESAPQAAPEG
jgi:penicillin-binding protein 1A